MTVTYSPDQALMIWATRTCEGKAKQIFASSVGEEGFDIDHELILANHIEGYILDCWAKEWRGWFLHLIGKTAKSDWTVTEKMWYTVLVFRLGLWLRKHPMPGFPKFEAHDPKPRKK